MLNTNKRAFQKDAYHLLAAQMDKFEQVSWPPGVTTRESLYSEVQGEHLLGRGGGLYSEVLCPEGAGLMGDRVPVG